MSYPHFGYTYPSAASSMTSSQLLMSAASSAAHTSIATSCCETGRPIMTDPQTGQTICSCGQYSSAAGLLTYPRVAGLTDGVYTASAYAHATQAGLVPFGTDPSAFYPTLNTTYDLKDNAEAWRGLTQPCYPYDPTMAGYPYGAGYGMDIGVGNRRKNATRETTSTLKAWLYEHRKNPYPTKGEKIMLAIITKMTLTQVSTWFANARRRLKKENKMTWSPRNRCGDGRDKLDSDAEDDDNDLGENSNGSIKNDDDKKDEDDDDDVKDINDTGSDVLSIGDGPDLVSAKLLARSDTSSPPLGPVSTVTSAHPGPSSQPLQPQGRRPSPISHIMHPTPIRSTSTDTSPTTNTCSNNSASASGHLNPQKPRIWSLAHTATSSSPPPLGSRRSPPNLPAVVSVGAGQSSYPNSMNSVRQWIEGAYPVSVSHSVGLSHAYALAARSMAGAGVTMTTPSSHHHQHVQDTPPNTPPIIPRFPITSLSVQSSLGLAARDLALHNGIEKLSGESRGLGDIKPDLKSVDPDEQTKTAFKPVTKSKFDEIVKV